MLSRQKTFFSVMLFVFRALAAGQQVTISPQSLTFGAHTPGNSSTPETITVLNGGGADVNVTSISASGGFSETNNCSTLRAGQKCTIDVTYISSIVGSTKGVVAINDNAAPNPQIVNLMGTVIAPMARAPGGLNF